MKKVFVSVCTFVALFFFFSCRSAKEALPLSAISGAWDIVEINGSKVVPVAGQSVPFVVFDVSTGRISGNAGCNRLMGSFDTAAEPGSLDVKSIATTRMMCEDMMVERNVVNALNQIKTYRKAGEDKIYLYNEYKRPVILLEQQKAVTGLAMLAGSWTIKEVNGEAIPTGMEKQPFLSFDVEKKTVHGNAGCNLVNGGFETEEGDATSIAFSRLATTMMACPDMEWEGKILKALNAVKSFGGLSTGEVGLYDAEGTLLLLLVRSDAVPPAGE